MAQRSSAAPTAVPPRSPHRYRLHRLIRASRYAEGLEHQGDCAALVGVSKFRQWEWETGRIRPSEDELRRLCEALPVLEHFLRFARRLDGRGVEVAGRR